MKLSEYLKKEQLSLRHFADKIGVSHATIYKYCKNLRTPSLKNLKKIEKATEGKVTIKDF